MMSKEDWHPSLNRDMLRFWTLAILKSFVFWDIMSHSPLKVNPCFGGKCHLHYQGRRISKARNQCESRWQAELKVEATCSPETSVDFQWTTWCYIPEDRTLRNHRCENVHTGGASCQSKCERCEVFRFSCIKGVRFNSVSGNTILWYKYYSSIW
jgi:hypothetical protein